MDRRRALLWGRSPAVSRQVAALAVALLGLVSAVFFTDLNTLWPLPLTASGPIILVGLAALEAFYNDGLVPAGLLAFAAALPAFVFHPPRGRTFAVTPTTAPLAVLEAAAVAVALGSVGFAVGAALRRRRDRRRGERFAPSPTAIPELLVGRDRRRAARWLLVAVVEVAAVLAAGWFGLLPFGIGGAEPVGIALLVALMALPAGWLAATDGGVLVCWVLAFAPVFGVFLAIQLRFVASMAPDRPVIYAMGTAAMLSAPVAAAAFVVGVALRRARRRFGPLEDGAASPD